MSIRKVVKVVKGVNTTDGAGVNLQRVIGYHDTKDFDPFLMLDAFDSKNPNDYIAGFPWHPHRGIETVTYLIHGAIEHGDSLGNHGSISDGECQWMTAGCGIIHQEMPQASKHMLGTQLWINLPQKAKMTPPVYNDIKANDIIEVFEQGVRVAIVSGAYKGHEAPTHGNFVKTTYLDVKLAPEANWQLTVPESDTVFIYIMLGSVEIGEKTYKNRNAVLFGHGNSVSITGGPDGARFMLLAGKPLNEPIAWGGPIVMNTKEELQKAFQEIDAGTFGKECHKAHKDFYQ